MSGPGIILRYDNQQISRIKVIFNNEICEDKSGELYFPESEIQIFYNRGAVTAHIWCFCRNIAIR